jgi:LPS O-antigen subunit length determinant protein (WzzB/FepE family)
MRFTKSWDEVIAQGEQDAAQAALDEKLTANADAQLDALEASLAQAKEAGIEGATLRDALAFIDWADDGN